MSSQFTLLLGLPLAAMVLITGWLFRSSAAPLWQRVCVPAIAISFACYAPLTVGRMLGFPVIVRQADLPNEAQLRGFVPSREEKRVFLWLSTESQEPPRAYETALTDQLKQTLREAQQAMENGRPVFLTKLGAAKGRGARRDTNNRLGLGDDQPYVLDPAAMRNLPAKE